MLNASSSYTSKAVFGCDGCGAASTDKTIIRVSVNARSDGTVLKDYSVFISGPTPISEMVETASKDYEVKPGDYTVNGKTSANIVYNGSNVKTQITWTPTKFTLKEGSTQVVTGNIDYMNEDNEKVSISTYSEWLGSDYMTCSSEAFTASPNGTYNKGQSVKVEAKYTGGGTCYWTNCGSQTGYSSPVFQGWYDSSGKKVSSSQSFTTTLDSSKEYTAKWGGASCEGEVEETGACTFNYDASATGSTPNLMGTITYNLECTGEGQFTGNEKITVDFANKSGFVTVYLSGTARNNSFSRKIKSDMVYITGDVSSLDSQVHVYANGKNAHWVTIKHVDEMYIK